MSCTIFFLAFIIVVLTPCIANAAVPVQLEDTGVFVPTNPATQCINVGEYQQLDDIAPKLQTLIHTQSPRCVYFPEGLYHSSDISPSSDSTFLLATGAVLRTIPGTTQVALIHAVGIERFAILGNGTLHGSAEEYIEYFEPKGARFQPRSDIPRPHLLFTEKVQGLYLNGVHFQNCSFWNLRLLSSANILIDSVRVTGDERFPNNDGIDPDSSVNVTIVNSYINVGDDGICPKSNFEHGPLTNLYVQNCKIRSKSHAIKFGSNTGAEMSDCLFDNVHIFDSHSGLSIQMRDNGSVHDVIFSNIDVETRYSAARWWGAGEPISITSEPYSSNNAPDVGDLYNIRFENITARSENGAYISGFREPVRPLRNLEMVNVKIVLDHWTNYSQSTASACLDASSDPDHRSPIDCRGTIDRRPSLNGCQITSVESEDSDTCRWKSATGSVPLRIEHSTGVSLTNVVTVYNVGARSYPTYWGKECFEYHDVAFSGPKAVTCQHTYADNTVEIL